MRTIVMHVIKATITERSKVLLARFALARIRQELNTQVLK